MSILELFGKKALVFDGAMGTMLQARGLKPGQLPETLNRLSPSAVLDVHRAYINAGADVIIGDFTESEALMGWLGL